MIQKTSDNFSNPETKKLAKKLQLISKIYFKINPEDPDSLKVDLEHFYDECLNNIENNLYLIASETKYTKIPSFTPSSISDEKLTLFKISEIKLVPLSPKENQKSVEDILEDVPQTLEEEAIKSPPNEHKLPTPVNEKWTDDKSSVIDVKNLPKPTNDADWLQDF